MGMQESDRLFTELEPLLSEAGLKLVELSVSRHRGSVQVRITVFSPRGTGTAECAKAHRIAYPKAVDVLVHSDPGLEVSSPGIDRALRSDREWAIFSGKGVRVLLRDEQEWFGGRIQSADGRTVTLACPGGSRVIELEAVSKARLDSSQEGD
jgi:ribosome maturation factor RimP